VQAAGTTGRETAAEIADPAILLLYSLEPMHVILPHLRAHTTILQGSWEHAMLFLQPEPTTPTWETAARRSVPSEYNPRRGSLQAAVVATRHPEVIASANVMAHIGVHRQRIARPLGSFPTKNYIRHPPAADDDPHIEPEMVTEHLQDQGSCEILLPPVFAIIEIFQPHLALLCIQGVRPRAT
jgi:hypothetical protein